MNTLDDVAFVADHPPLAADGPGPAGVAESWSTEGVEPGDLGIIVSVSGTTAGARLYKANASEDDHRLSLGRLVAIRLGASRVVGVIAGVTISAPPQGMAAVGMIVANVDFVGEIKLHGTPGAFFQRGMTAYPTIGDKLTALGHDELSLIHKISGGDTIDVGTLQLDETIPAYINFDEMLCKHFAVLGTTGVGKSTSVALILQQILKKKANLRILLLDPHNEYGGCFGDQSHVVSPRNLRLPFWLFNFEEIVDVFFRGRPGVEDETEILSELIPLAKAQFAANTTDRVQLRKTTGTGAHTADTPVPYRISDLVTLINNRMGKLENKSAWAKYHRLLTRIETLGHDTRYAFMFSSMLIEDIMVDVLSELFRLPPNGKPITVMQLAGFPTEVVDSLVSVICRMAFDYGVWSNGASPFLVGCEEAHRYAPADRKLGFGPTRKSLSRIAKEGRKYGVFLGAITQRPADLDPSILSQCSTVFAMRMANERDQAILQSAVPDAGSSLVQLVASLGAREAIVFGEGVALPMRFRFGNVPKELQPSSQMGERATFDAKAPSDHAFIQSVVDRWRESTTTTTRQKTVTAGDGAAETPAAAPGFAAHGG
jgi:hypothetical protein